jgi:hypothetical protein
LAEEAAALGMGVQVSLQVGLQLVVVEEPEDK